MLGKTPCLCVSRQYWPGPGESFQCSRVSGPCPVLIAWAGRARTTAIWLLCAGIALAVVGFGLPRRRVYAARVAIIVCGLWLITQLIVVTRVLRGSGTWDRTTWIIVGTQILCCVVILAVVMANRHALSANGETADQIAPTNAA